MTFHTDDSNEQLLMAFNKRNAKAFGVVYRMMYRELYLYAHRLFGPLNLSPEDAIQDIVVDIWCRKSVQFETLGHVKTFCFIALKNAYKNKIKHLKHQQRFELERKVEYEFSDDMERIEMQNMLYDAVKLLPENLATVICMSLEGYKNEEIAEKLGLAVQTIYNKRREAIILLKKILVK